jgi:hypothetical protein
LIGAGEFTRKVTFQQRANDTNGDDWADAVRLGQGDAAEAAMCGGQRRWSISAAEPVILFVREIAWN